MARNLILFGPLCIQIAIILQSTLDIVEMSIYCILCTRRSLNPRRNFRITRLGFAHFEQNEVILSAPE